MLTKSFGKLGWPVSAVGLGAWNIGNQWGDIDDVTAWSTVRAAYDAGMTLFDVAESYGFPNGLSEMRVGHALTGIRHNVILVSKIGNWGQRTGGAIPKTGVDSIRISGHAILGRLRTDWVDVILCHKGDLGDPTIFLEGFEALKDEGCLRAYGISTNDLDVLKRFNREGTCSVVQVDYSLLNRAHLSSAVPALLPGARNRSDGARPTGKRAPLRPIRPGAPYSPTRCAPVGTKAAPSKTSSSRARRRSAVSARSSRPGRKWFNLRSDIRLPIQPSPCRFPAPNHLHKHRPTPPRAAGH